MPDPVLPVTPVAPAPAETAEPLTAEAVKKLFDESLSGYSKKINDEVMGLRKMVKGATPDADVARAAPAAVTMDDLSASREIGRLEAQLGDAVIASLGEDYSDLAPREQARMLRMIARTRTAEMAPAVGGSQGVTPVKTQQTSRAEASAPRASVPRPANKREYFAMKPELRNILRQDPTFDPTLLPA